MTITRILASLAGCLLLGTLSAACIDSSFPAKAADPDPDPPPYKEKIDVIPPTWSTLPGKQMTFRAVDAVSNKPLVWSVPSELTLVETGPNEVTVISSAAEGTFTLRARSSVDPQVRGKAVIQVVGFGYSASAGGLAGDADQEPLSDVAVTRGKNGAADSRTFLAYLNAATGDNLLGVYELDFATQVDLVTGLHFNPVQRPRVAADAWGRAYLVEQFFDPTVGQRKRGIVRRNADGSISGYPWIASQQMGLQLVPGSDVACDDEGTLYFLTSNGISILVTRLVDMLGPDESVEIVGALNALGPQVQLAVDHEGHLLVAVDDVLSRWTPDPNGPGVNVEVLGNLGSAPADVDVDADGTIYVAFASEVRIYDRLGNQVGALAGAELPSGNVPFENLLGLGVDALGNLRLVDDPQVAPLLGAADALHTYALDVAKP